MRSRRAAARGEVAVANPQLENGYIRIASELAEAFAKHQFTGHESRVLWAILRRTYGFNKKSDKISFAQLASTTALPRRRVIEAVQSLVRKNALGIKSNGERHPSTYWINKDYETWVLDSAENCTIKPSAENRTKTSAENRTSPSAENRTHNIQRKDINIPATPSGGRRDIDQGLLKFSEQFLTYQQQQHPTLIKASSITPVKVRNGADTVEKLLRLDGYQLEQVKTALRWAVNDEFWCLQIRSLASLRNKGKNGETKFSNLLAAFQRSGQRTKAKKGAELVY